MGIHYWSKSAVLTLLVVLSIGHAHSATRKYVSMPSDGQVIGSGNGSTKNGDRIYVPGDGQTEYIPSSYGGGSKGTKLPIKVRYDYSIPRTLKGMTTTLRGGVVGVGLTVGLEWMLDQVDGFIDDAGKVRIRGGGQGEPVPGGYYWQSDNQKTAPTPLQACDLGFALIAQQNGYSGHSNVQAFPVNEGLFYCTASMTYNGRTSAYPQKLYATRFGDSCPSGSTYDPATGACMGAAGDREATDADFDLMEAAAAAQDSEWLKARLREHCEGGLSPESCYESLRDSVSLSGPSSVTENGPTSTTVGPTGTTTTTEKTDISITYGDNYYDYRTTKTTIVTNPDGTRETTTETEPETEQPREEEEQDINFTDSEFPPVEPFYQQKYPDGLQGVWQDAQAKIDNSQFMSFLQSFIPQFTGSCPSWSMSFNIASWASYGNVPFVNLCYVFDFIKVIMLVTALLTARAITFGG